MIDFKCPVCDTTYSVNDEKSGVKALCENCGCKIIIPRHGQDALLYKDSPHSHSPPSNEKLTVDWEADSLSTKDSNSETVGRKGTDKGKIIISFEDVPDRTVAPSQSSGRSLPPRMRRLLADAKNVQDRLAKSSFIILEELKGNPPDAYIVRYQIRGIESVTNGNICYREKHRAEFKLTSEYPRTGPLCRMLTPIFHPNIEPSVICIGDHWTAAETLIDLIIRVGEMIAYQSYNIKSPLDGEAAKWADLHHEKLPVDSNDLVPPEQ